MCSGSLEAEAVPQLRPERAMRPEKPPHGEPCNGCGGCCEASRCPLGAHVFGPGPDCPALTDDGCGLVLTPRMFFPGSEAELRDAAALLIGAGIGCDALLEGELPNLSWRARLYRYAARQGARLKRAKRAWGIK